jgi:hypothetical protein
MSEDERLARLVSELSAHEGYATGPRRFSRPVSDDDAAAIAAALAEEMEHGTRLRAELARQEGLTIACQAGCNACCEVMVMVYRPEALLIARWLSRPENQAIKEAFLAAYGPWRAAVGDAPERLTAHFVKGEQAAFDALHMAHWRRRVQCAFNQDGNCTIYEVRPIGCRNALALGTSDRCRADAERPAETLAFKPLDEFMKSATRLLRATHNATTRERHHLESVCSAVYRILTEEA